MWVTTEKNYTFRYSSTGGTLPGLFTMTHFNFSNKMLITSPELLQPLMWYKALKKYEPQVKKDPKIRI